jgi:XTP/dITP diphosphohydrolase
MTHQLLIASTNRGKLREIQAVLADLGVQLLLPDDIGLALDIAEVGHTYAENAAIKAQAYRQASGLLTLADDSGLEVDALGGEPGIFSARYSPKPHPSDADRRFHLLEKLCGQPQPWTAHFHCSVAIAVPDGAIYMAEGKCQGEIVAEERGENGFGYDPIFFMAEYNATMAELPDFVKNKISHRARALQAARPVLMRLLNLD